MLGTSEQFASFDRGVKRMLAFAERNSIHAPNVVTISSGDWQFDPCAFLLKQLRPKTFDILRQKWEPVSNDDWLAELGVGTPSRIADNLRKKVGVFST